MEIDKKEVGERLSKLRKDKNLTLDEVAIFLGVGGKSTVNAWERGRAYPKKYINMLAKLYNVDVDYINKGTLEEYIKKLITYQYFKQGTPIYITLQKYFTRFLKYNDEIFRDKKKFSEIHGTKTDDIATVDDKTVVDSVMLSRFFRREMEGILKKFTEAKDVYDDSVIIKKVIDYIQDKIYDTNSDLVSIIESIQYDLGHSLINIMKIIDRNTTQESLEGRYSDKTETLILEFKVALANLKNEYLKKIE